MNAKDFFNSIAPEWDSHEMHTQKEIETFLSFCGVKKGRATLDLGCGTGILSGILSSWNCAVTAMDLSEEMISCAKQKHAGENIRFLSENFYETKEGGFEQVVVFNAYPHFLNTAAFVKKLSEVLKAGGEFYILHNFGRERLDSHHEGLEEISRSLLPAGEEAKAFEGYFEILRAEESENYYLIHGRKKA